MFVRMVLGILVCWCCCCRQTSENTEMKNARASSQHTDFKISQKTLAVAPKMQDHLIQLLRFDGPHFQVKPMFVFLDGDKLFRSPPSVLVTALTFVHLAYYRGSDLLWSGSILFDPVRGVGLNSVLGYQIDVVPGASEFEVSFKDGEVHVSCVLSATESGDMWVEDGSSRLYVNHYLLPHAIRKK